MTQYYASFFYAPGHPYGRVPDEATYPRMSRQDIAGYHQRAYVGRNLVVIVAGEFDQARGAQADRRNLRRRARGRSLPLGRRPRSRSGRRPEGAAGG